SRIAAATAARRWEISWTQTCSGAAARAPSPTRTTRGKRGAMTKADLVEAVVTVSDLSKRSAEIVVNTLFQSIVEALQKDDKIELRGFGSFRVRRRRSRQGRNPKTGD